MTSLLRERLAGGLLLLWIAGVVFESTLGRGVLWGGHALGFLPPGWFVLAPLAGLAVVALTWRARPAGDEEPGNRALSPALRRALPWLLGALAAGAFWLLRERHLFWGDALPLSINVPAGQSFHPDEPLTLWLHHALWSMGGGRWSAVDAIAAGSALAGGLYVAIACGWLLRRAGDPGRGLFAVAVLVTQGSAAIFFGHVENYSYVAVAQLVFLTGAVDALEGRGSFVRPLLAFVVACAFHVLGALLVVPALALVAVGLARGETRRAALLGAVVAAGVLGAAVFLARGAFGAEPPWVRLEAVTRQVLTQPRDMTAASFFSWRHLRDAWSHIVQMGPFSLALVAAFVALDPPRRFLSSAPGRVLALAAIALYGPFFLTGEGNLGAARNWDLFAGPASAVTLFGLCALLETTPAARGRRLLGALLAVSVFQLAPWVALNTSVAATTARIEALPLGRGRAPMMLGTQALNAGDLAGAERWFRHSLAEDSLNVNSWSGLGLVLARTGRLDEAREPMNRAVRLKPTTPLYRRDLAQLHLDAGRWDEAREQLRALVVLEPREAGAWMTLADCERRLGYADSTVFVLEAARRSLPGDAGIGAALADAYAYWVASAGEAGDRATFRRAWSGFERAFPEDPRVIEWRPRAAEILGGPAPGR